MTLRRSNHPLGGGSVKIDTTPVRFEYTGELQKYEVQAGVKKLRVECVAAGGFGGVAGGKVDCVMDVKSKKLFVWVGKVPETREKAEYNASDVRTADGAATEENSLKSRIIVAGAAGSDGATTKGGVGGGLQAAQGGNSYIAGGVGGNQIEGGNPGYYVSGTGSVWAGGTKGQLGLGGEAPGSCGAGGSGYFGGGGGSYGEIKKVGGIRTGGGGGSSYTDAVLCTEVVHTPGANSGNGYVIITAIEE